jgi:hypothetical protein
MKCDNKIATKEVISTREKATSQTASREFFFMANGTSSKLPPVFDTLTHFITKDAGIELGKPLGIEGYLSYVKSWQNPNVKAINLICGACPQYETAKEIIIPCKWVVENNNITEFSYRIQRNRSIIKQVESNCYSAVNNLVFDELKKISGKYPKLKLFYSPMIHPRKTSIDELEKLISESKKMILGFKIHGIATNSCPKDFNPELAKYLAKTGIPLIIHTDYYNRTLPSVIKDTNDAKIYLQKINNPKDWIVFCIKYSIKASLQHGARNDSEVYRIIKENRGQFNVGLGPKLDGQCERIVEKTNNFLESVFERLGPDFCIFSSDYPHNETGEDMTREIISLLSKEEQKKVFHENAEKFFEVDLKD